MKNHKIYEVNRAFILGCVASRGYSVVEFCKKLGCSRTFFYACLKKTYASKGNAKFLKKIARELDLSCEDSGLLWTN